MRGLRCQYWHDVRSCHVVGGFSTRISRKFHGVSFCGVHDHLTVQWPRRNVSAVDGQRPAEKKGKGKGQVKGAGGNSVGKGAGKAKSQTDFPSRRGVAEPSPEGRERVVRFPRCHGQHRRPRGSVSLGGVEKGEAGSVPRPGWGTSRPMCTVCLSSREASPQGRRCAGKVAGGSHNFWSASSQRDGLVWRRCVPKLLRKCPHLHSPLAIPSGQRKCEDSNSWSRIFAAKSVLSRREKMTNGAVSRSCGSSAERTSSCDDSGTSTQPVLAQFSHCPTRNAIRSKRPTANEDGCWPLQEESDPHEDRLCQIWSQRRQSG